MITDPTFVPLPPLDQITAEDAAIVFAGDFNAWWEIAERIELALMEREEQEAC